MHHKSGQDLQGGPLDTLGLKQLKAIAAELGCISPSGDKRKKATWMRAIEGTRELKDSGCHQATLTPLLMNN